MLYSDHSTAEQSSGLYQINVARLIQHQDGQESSATWHGTGEDMRRTRWCQWRRPPPQCLRTPLLQGPGARRILA